jgi:hypothetical protein
MEVTEREKHTSLPDLGIGSFNSTGPDKLCESFYIDIFN